MNSFNKIPYKAVIVLFSKIIIKRLSRDQLNIFRKVEKITKSFIKVNADLKYLKVRNWQNWILSVPRVSVRRKKKTPWVRQYQSYISNWYVNGKVFTSTTAWEPKNLIFFFSKKFEIEFDLYFDLCWRAEIIQVGLNMHL